MTLVDQLTAYGVPGENMDHAPSHAEVVLICALECSPKKLSMEAVAQDHQQFCKHAILILALKVRDIAT